MVIFRKRGIPSEYRYINKSFITCAPRSVASLVIAELRCPSTPPLSADVTWVAIWQGLWEVSRVCQGDFKLVTLLSPREFQRKTKFQNSNTLKAQVFNVGSELGG